MVYVARYTPTPEYDAVRKWTAWMNMVGDTPEAVADLAVNSGYVPQRIAELAAEDEEYALAWALDNLDIRYHEVAGLWMLVHNPRGLSCFRLDAESVEEAIAEAAAKHNDGRLGDWWAGKVTSGAVRVVAQVPVESDIQLWIFWAEDVGPEPEMAGF